MFSDLRPWLVSLSQQGDLVTTRAADSRHILCPPSCCRCCLGRDEGGIRALLSAAEWRSASQTHSILHEDKLSLIAVFHNMSRSRTECCADNIMRGTRVVLCCNLAKAKQTCHTQLRVPIKHLHTVLTSSAGVCI